MYTYLFLQRQLLGPSIPQVLTQYKTIYHKNNVYGHQQRNHNHCSKSAKIIVWANMLFDLILFLAFWGWMSHIFLENVCFTYHDSIQNNIFWKYLAIQTCKPILPTKLHRQNANNLSRRYVVMPNLRILFKETIYFKQDCEN